MTEPWPSSATKSASDQRLAEAAVLIQQDMGDDYRATPFTPSPRDREYDVALNACLGRPPTATHETARAFSPRFTKGDVQEVLAGVTFVDSKESAQADIAAMSDTTNAIPCLKEAFIAQLRRYSNLAQVDEVSQLSPAPGGLFTSLI